MTVVMQSEPGSLEHLPEEVQFIINKLVNEVVIIEHFADTKQTYNDLIEKYYDYIKAGFEHAELRSCPVYFKLRDTETDLVHSLRLTNFLTNLMFWEPMVRMKVFEYIDASYIVDCRFLSTRLIEDYANAKLIEPFLTRVSNLKRNTSLASMTFNLSRISKDFNIMMGLSINTEVFITEAKRNPRFNEIIRTHIEEGMQPSEIEKYLLELTREQIEILKNSDNILRPILMSGTGIKIGQYKEFAVNGGMAPDLDGVTIPIPINSNFVVGGLGNVTHYYIDALKGRKSVIMNKTVMGKSGHFSRMVMLITTDIKLRKDKGDCGTKRPIEMTIRSKQHLKRLTGRNYRLKEQRKYQTMRGNEYHLIGASILLRSPITCASDHICKTCYGDLYYTNVDLESVGGFAGTEITNPLSQAILSSKHLLTTNSDMIEFNEEFYQFFTINANEVMMNIENEDINIANYSIVFIRENIVTIDEFSDNDFNSYVALFHVKNKLTGEMIEMREKNDKELYVSNDLKKIIDRSKGGKEIAEIDFTQIKDDDSLFAVEISNNELTKPLYSIMNLLNRVDHEGCRTIDQMAQKLLDLMIESALHADSVHGEIMIRPIIRSKKNVLNRPNFGTYGSDDDYQILTIEAGLKRNPSPLISISFQDLGRQFTSPLTFHKTGSSFVDPFFQAINK